MSSATANFHFATGEVLSFRGMNHSDVRSISIDGQGYGGVTLFVTLAQAQQIADYINALIAEPLNWPVAELQGAPDGETPQADEKPGPDYELQGKEF